MTEKFEKVIDSFQKETSKLRTGQVSPSLFEMIYFEYYGTKTPISQVASITIQEGTNVTIKPFDPSSLSDIETAINKANLNVNAQNTGEIIRVLFPKLTQENRLEQVKELKKIVENGKVNMRNVRRDLNDSFKKDKTLTEDDLHQKLNEIQKLTDDYIAKIETLAKQKENEITKI